MASDLSFVQYVVDQIGQPDLVSFRKMFGEYAVYFKGKVVFLICDNQCYIKPTNAGRALAGEIELAPPYPGAKDYFLVDDRLDDSDWMCEMASATAAELPEPKEKKPRSRARTST